jgi:hypothetical protein
MIETEKYKYTHAEMILVHLKNYFIASIISCSGEISEAGKFKVTASCINFRKVQSII